MIRHVTFGYLISWWAVVVACSDVVLVYNLTYECYLYAHLSHYFLNTWYNKKLGYCRDSALCPSWTVASQGCLSHPPISSVLQSEYISGFRTWAVNQPLGSPTLAFPLNSSFTRWRVQLLCALSWTIVQLLFCVRIIDLASRHRR